MYELVLNLKDINKINAKLPSFFWENIFYYLLKCFTKIYLEITKNPLLNMLADDRKGKSLLSQIFTELELKRFVDIKFDYRMFSTRPSRLASD